MADATRFRDTPDGGDIPRLVTLPMRANTLVIGGTIACVDADGRAAGPADVAGPVAARNAVGVFRADFDNRATAPEGGGAGAINAEIKCGVFGFGAEAGGEPVPGDVCYIVDNQTVSTLDNLARRGLAGYCTAVETLNGVAVYYVFISPAVTGQIIIAANEASQLDSAQAAITALEGEVDDLQTDEAMGRIDVPLASFAVVSTGLPLATAFNDGNADGLQWSEGLLYRFNPASTAAIGASVPLPAELDGTKDVTIRILASRVGADDAATACFTVAAYFAVDGAAPNAGDDCGGDTGLVAAATTVVDTVTCTIAAADVPDAGPALLSFSIVPKAGSLPDDDLLIHAVTVEFAKKLTAS